MIDPRVEIGHVHLKVADLERALGFWRDVLGFEVQETLGDHAAFLSAAGLNPVAARYPGRRAPAAGGRAVLDAGIPLEGASDHGVSEAIYLRDPEGNGVELYRDRPREEWARHPDGRIAMKTEPLDLAGLLAELGP